ncbi:MAG: hypothetical protein IPM28_09425 [Chloracidobacterium sp.]|nr:hypothetical protein [Chloracidobacterium sp.]
MSLIEGLQNLTFANRGFKDTAARHHRNFSDISFPALVKAVDSIDALAKPQRPADSHIREWQAYIDGQTELLSPRAIRNLSWYPDVATDCRFWDVVKLSERSRNSAKTIQGLVYSYHSKWKEVQQLPQFLGLREAVKGFRGPNGILKKWQENLHLILFADSVAKLAQELSSGRMPLDYSIEQLRLFEDTQFFREVVSECARSCSQNLGVAEILDFFLNQILSWDKHDIQIFREHVDAAIKCEAFDRSEDVKARLINYVVNDVQRLGDPRLNPARWIGIEESKEKVLQHLSKKDIVFFFEKVMTDDVHGRAKFWLRYVKSMSRSRPLLTDLDRSRLSTALARRGNAIRHYGRTTGQHSAFLLDFGSVLAIEFEGVGACYLYDAKTRDRFFRDFFTGNPFNDQILKMPKQALYRKSHQGNWQWVLGQALAQSGIYPS